MGSVSLSGITNIGEITLEDMDVDRSSFGDKLPGTNSSGNVEVPILGVKRTITLKGTIKFSSDNDYFDWLTDIDANWCDAVYPESKELTMSSGKIYLVKPVRFKITKVNPGDADFMLTVRRVSNLVP